ncbi:MAG: hypothetical protein AAF206_23375 [Bacteroidota bacterium]
MHTKRIHYFSGLLLTLFIGVHLINHVMSLWGAAAHIDFMHTIRPFYRNFVVESLLLIAVGVQIISGISLLRKKRSTASRFFERLQLWSGAYLAFFLLIHVSAVLGGRFVLDLDTNFYFGVAGLNRFPFNLFFIPYYGLAMISFFAHLAAIHAQKMRRSIFSLSPSQQSRIFLGVGLVFSLLLLYGLTNHLQGVELPAEYEVMVGG